MPTTFSVKISTRRSFQRAATAGAVVWRFRGAESPASSANAATGKERVGALRAGEASRAGVASPPRERSPRRGSSGHRLSRIQSIRRRVLASGSPRAAEATSSIRSRRACSSRRIASALASPGGIGLGGGVEDGDLRGFLRIAFVVGVLGAFVVRARRACERAGARDSAQRNRQATAPAVAVHKGAAVAGHLRLAGPCPFPLLAHRHPMPREGDGERLDGREQLLLQAHHEQGGGGPGARRPGLQPCLPQAAVFVEEAGEDELRSVLRQAVDDDAPHVPFRKAALDRADVLLDAPYHHVFESVLSPDRHPAGEAVRVEQLSSRVEKLLEWPLWGVAERNRRCSKRPPKSRTARVNFVSMP